MKKSSLKIRKRQVPVALWVHPEGKVVGSMFLTFPSPESAGGEQPADVINRAVDFLVFKLDDTEEIRFYNKSSIVRVEYRDADAVRSDSGRPQSCRITMMDGALFDGEICKQQPEENSRLYDYMNDSCERFLTLRLDAGSIALINKSYIVSIASRESTSSSATDSKQRQTAVPERLALAD